MTDLELSTAGGPTWKPLPSLVAADGPLNNAWSVPIEFMQMPVVLVWPAAAFALLGPVRSAPLKVLALSAAIWVATTAGLALLGFADHPRFLAPAAAAVCVLGAVGGPRRQRSL